RSWADRSLLATRIGYVAALLALTVTTERWLADRGGAAGPYGVTYNVRVQQAESIVRRLDGDVGDRSGAVEVPSGLSCALLPPELKWLVAWLDREHRPAPGSIEICDGWVEQGDRLAY